MFGAVFGGSVMEFFLGRKRPSPPPVPTLWMTPAAQTVYWATLERGFAGDEHVKALVRDLTEADVASFPSAYRPGVIAFREMLAAEDPYVWRDPWGGH